MVRRLAALPNAVCQVCPEHPQAVRSDLLNLLRVPPQLPAGHHHRDCARVLVPCFLSHVLYPLFLPVGTVDGSGAAAAALCRGFRRSPRPVLPWNLRGLISFEGFYKMVPVLKTQC